MQFKILTIEWSTHRTVSQGGMPSDDERLWARQSQNTLDFRNTDPARIGLARTEPYSLSTLVEHGFREMGNRRAQNQESTPLLRPRSSIKTTSDPFASLAGSCRIATPFVA